MIRWALLLLLAGCASNPTLDTDFTKTPKALREELLRLI